MNYWLIKSEPESYSWDDLVKLGEDMWEGVRNYQARNFLKEMRVGDLAFFYHSGKAREIVGITEVVKDPYPDPTDDTNTWWTISIVPKEPFKNSVTLATIKSDENLNEIKLVKNSRLSVMPISQEHAQILFDLSK